MTHRRASTTDPDILVKRYITGVLAAILMVGSLITVAPPASAGCVDPDWATHPFAQMCDSPVDSDGMWVRCLEFHNGGPYSPAETDCYAMSAGDPPKADPIFATPPTHIDP
jgi:hypothetical protein